jgi:hypothetical protein
MKTSPKFTKNQLISWCPQPRGSQPIGHHSAIPALDNENSETPPAGGYVGGYEENRLLNQKLLAAFREVKKRDGDDPETGPRFLLQWRIFPNAANPVSSDPNQCGCGCSCGCG